MALLAVVCAGMLSVLVACGGPNHLGNPLTLPVRGIAAAVENASYDRRRAKVKAWIVENETALRAEDFSGPTTRALLNTLPQENRQRARADLIESAAHSDFAERATVIVMVLSD